ncbi:HAMP domain-containing sensor histidine kinase [Cellulosimicrobium sp. Marseille-Q4280]|uniref:sensor histidine kinase n=1 Tax=Cellulosimicrobium sp. Marseille-Q4280 TaxID=2937992 RepID=UPI0020409B87|nr:HAMP domain-containing sensor histidine kinase [Cellulosimicrobium sp. Marseille-Q4280]
MSAGSDRTATDARAVPPSPPGDAVRPAGDTASGTSGDAAAGGTSDPGPTAQRPFGRRVPTEGWSWLARVPLRARLVGIIVLLLAAGQGIAALLTTTVVSQYLVDQVDDQLERSASEVAESTLNQGPVRSVLPSDYYVVARDRDGNSSALGWPQTVSRYGEPDIPAMSDPEVRDRAGDPFTVSSSGGSDPAKWRVVPFFIRSELTGEVQGTAFVALPLTGIHETVKVLGRTLALSALGIALIGGAVAYMAVQRALRPLREIEETAAGIAGGDLARRVRPAPPTTEVGSLATSLNAMLSQIEEAFAVQEASEARMRTFVSDASHELRTPLATIRGYGELYRMGALDTPEKVDDTMGRIEDSATRMGALVNDLLALARLDEGRPLRHEPVDLAALAKDSAQDLHALDPSRDVQVVGLAAGSVAPEPLRVVGDEDRLRQVLANLVGNVARHTPRGTAAQIALGVVEAPPLPTDGTVQRAPHGTARGATAVLEVRDHGPGVPAGQEDRVFERFYRADSSRNRASGGSGLGLAIVAAIVAAHRGHVSVRSTDDDGGLTVRVELPLAS